MCLRDDIEWQNVYDLSSSVSCSTLMPIVIRSADVKKWLFGYQLDETIANFEFIVYKKIDYNFENKITVDDYW